MNGFDVFSARDLRVNAGHLIKDAEEGKLSIITKHGSPAVVAIPFDDTLLEFGVKKSLAFKLLKENVLSLPQAAKFSGLKLTDFLELNKIFKIKIVDYPPEEIEDDLENLK